MSRVGARLSELYPSMVGGPLWQLYQQVMVTGQPGQLPDFRYEEKRAGVIAESLFDVSVRRVLGGLLVCWQRLDEDQRRMEKAELLGSLGWAEYDLTTGRSQWSPGMYRIFERDPALGPLSRAEQAAALVPEDFGLREAAWQTLDSGATSDVTVRFRAGTSVKYLRILSDTARDADGAPLKIYAVVQDVTARVDSRTAIEQLSDQLHTREMTALAEHRLAGQLQNLIQPVPREPFPLAGLEAMVSYLPAESAVRVGGDWYHAQTLPDGQVALAVGDVAGHGLEAASGMAHLRFAPVAWLSIGIRDPGDAARPPEPPLPAVGDYRDRGDRPLRPDDQAAVLGACLTPGAAVGPGGDDRRPRPAVRTAAGRRRRRQIPGGQPPPGSRRPGASLHRRARGTAVGRRRRPAGQGAAGPVGPVRPAR